MKKKMLLTAMTLALAMGSVLSACSSSTSPAAESKKPENTAQSNEPVTLEMWGRWEEANKQINETIEAFQKKYPNIKVKYTAVPFAQYVAQTQTAISGNNLPDIFGAHPNLPVFQLTRLGVIRSLNDLITEEKKKQFYEGTFSEGETMMAGEVYGLPLFNPMRTSQVMYYNKAVLKKAGLTEKDIPKTWDELYQFSKKVKEATNGEAYGLIVGVKATSQLPLIVQQMATAITPEVIPDLNVPPFNYKTGKYQFDSPGIIQSLDYFKKLQDEKLLHPNSVVMSFREGTALMEAGKAALVMDGAFFSNQMKKEQLDDYGVAPLPTLDGKPQYAMYKGGSNASFYVSKGTKHYNEVKLFLQFMMDELYPKLLRDGIEYSPIMAQNESTKITHPIAAQALKIQSETVKLVPRPFTKNIETLKVATEMSGKFPKTTLSNIAEGYLSGQLKDVKAALTQLSDETNKVFFDSMKKVQSDGGKVSESDYIFPDWQPFQPYKK
ncbi:MULTISPECIES: ABC transporter substrate-binding protein [unclassified Paenibacillus]|uniref:ABC transporter substrate-binding protein n=1 Tax=unclassified Paenibacillus TaxID=185978 RepID=UPI00363A0F1B